MKKKTVPYNLQFFGTNDSPDLVDQPTIDGQENGDGEEDQDKPTERSFTQAQVNALLAREKKEGRRAAFRALGFETEAEAKSALSILSKFAQDTKPETSEDPKSDNTELIEAQKRAEIAESKLACINAGVNKEAIEDVLAIAKAKITDDKTLDTILTEMSKEVRYASFFADTSNHEGTGSDPGHVRDQGGKETGKYGARLAASSIQKKDTKKSSYF